MLLFLFALAGVSDEIFSVALALPSILHTTVLFNISKHVPVLYEMNFVSSNSYAETLTPSISECDCIWRWGLRGGNQVNQMGPNPI